MIKDRLDRQAFLEKQEQLERKYKISQCHRYVLDQQEGTLRLTGPDHFAVLEAIPAGIYDRNTQSWQWGWDCWDLRRDFREKARPFCQGHGSDFQTGILNISEKEAEDLAAVCMLEQPSALGLCRLGWEEPGQELFCILIQDQARIQVQKAIEGLLEETDQALLPEENLFEAFGRAGLYRHMGTDFLIDSLLAVPELLQEMDNETIRDLAECLYEPMQLDREEDRDRCLMLMQKIFDQGRLGFFQQLVEIPVENQGDLRHFCDLGMYLNYSWGKGQYREISRYLGRMMLSIPAYTEEMRNCYLREKYYKGGFWLLYGECVLDNPDGWDFIEDMLKEILAYGAAEDQLGYFRRRVYRFLTEIEGDVECRDFLKRIMRQPIIQAACLQAAYERMHVGWEELEQGKQTVNQVCADFQTFARHWLNDRDRDEAGNYDYRKMEICREFLRRICQVPGKLELNGHAIDCLAKTVAYVVTEADPVESGQRPDLALMLRLYKENCVEFFQQYAGGQWADVDFAASLYHGFDGKYQAISTYMAQFLLNHPVHACYMEQCYLIGTDEDGPRYEDADWLMDRNCVSEEPGAQNVHSELMMRILEDMPEEYEGYDRVMEKLDGFLQQLSCSGELWDVQLWECMAQWLADTSWSLHRCYAVFANEADWLQVYPGRSDLYRSACIRFLNSEEKRRRYRLSIVGYLQEELGLSPSDPAYEALHNRLLESMGENKGS